MSDAVGDFYGVPEYFVSNVATECAGNGNVRVFNYAKRNGVLIPQFTIVIAAADLFVASRHIEEAAQNFLSHHAIGNLAH